MYIVNQGDEPRTQKSREPQSDKPCMRKQHQAHSFCALEPRGRQRTLVVVRIRGKYLPLPMTTLHIYRTRHGVQYLYIYSDALLRKYWESKLQHVSTRPTTCAIHSGDQASIYFNFPLACSTRTAHLQSPKQLVSRERASEAYGKICAIVQRISRWSSVGLAQSRGTLEPVPEPNPS